MMTILILLLSSICWIVLGAGADTDLWMMGKKNHHGDESISMRLRPQPLQSRHSKHDKTKTEFIRYSYTSEKATKRENGNRNRSRTNKRKRVDAYVEHIGHGGHEIKMQNENIRNRDDAWPQSPPDVSIATPLTSTPNVAPSLRVPAPQPYESPAIPTRRERIFRDQRNNSRPTFASNFMPIKEGFGEGGENRHDEKVGSHLHHWKSKAPKGLPYHVSKEEEYSSSKYSTHRSKSMSNSYSKGALSGKAPKGLPYHVLKEEEYSHSKYRHKPSRVSAMTRYLIRETFETCERTCRVMPDHIVRGSEEESDDHDDDDENASRDYISHSFGGEAVESGGYENRRGGYVYSYRGNGHRHNNRRYLTSKEGNHDIGKGKGSKDGNATKNQCCKGGVSFLKFKVHGIGQNGGRLSLEDKMLCDDDSQEFSSSLPVNSSGSPGKGGKGKGGTTGMKPQHHTSSIGVFMDCNDQCIDEPSVRCSTTSATRNIKIQNGQQICIGAWNSLARRLELDSNMSRSVLLHFIPDENNNNDKNKMWMAILHTSCSKPIYAPYGISFVDTCEDAGRWDPSIMDDSHNHNATSPGIAFQDGISPIYHHHKRTEFQNSPYRYKFAECRCKCNGDDHPVVLSTTWPSQTPVSLSPPSQGPSSYRKSPQGISTKPSIGVLGVPETSQSPSTNDSPELSQNPSLALGVPQKSQNPSLALGIPQKSQKPSINDIPERSQSPSKSVGEPERSQSPSIGGISQLCNRLCEEWIANHCVLTHTNEPCALMSGRVDTRFLSSPLYHDPLDDPEYHKTMIDLLEQLLDLLA